MGQKLLLWRLPGRGGGLFSGNGRVVGILRDRRGGPRPGFLGSSVSNLLCDHGQIPEPLCGSGSPSLCPLLQFEA